MNNCIIFAAIILSQVIFFIVISFFCRISYKAIVYNLSYGLLIGLPFGLVYDILFGKYVGIFFYRFEWSFAFIALNSLLSYGIAISTSLSILSNLKFSNRNKLNSYNSTLLIIISSIITLLCIQLVFISNILFKMILSGIIILALCEILLYLKRIKGVTQFYNKKNFWIIFKIYTFSVAMGIWYEASNILFPLWSWRLSTVLTRLETELIIIFFGYFILVFPMVTILIITKQNKPTQPDAGHNASF